MSVKLTDNSTQLIFTKGVQASLAIRYMLEDVYRKAEVHTPKRYGNLRSDVLRVITGPHGTITWDKQYAAAQEVGTTRKHPIVHYTTPGTGPHFAENAVKEVTKSPATYWRKAGLI